jgi:hypothetical protein
MSQPSVAAARATRLDRLWVPREADDASPLGASPALAYIHSGTLEPSGSSTSLVATLLPMDLLARSRAVLHALAPGAAVKSWCIHHWRTWGDRPHPSACHGIHHWRTWGDRPHPSACHGIHHWRTWGDRPHPSACHGIHAGWNNKKSTFI